MSVASLSPRVTMLCCSIVLGLHLAYCANYANEAKQYFKLGLMSVDLQNYTYRFIGLGTTSHNDINLTLASTSVAISFWHAVGLFRAVRASIRYRRLLLDVPDGQFVHQIKTKLQNLKAKPTAGHAERRKPVRATSVVLKARLKSLKASLLFVRREFFTMNGRHFEAGTNIRETIEIVTQFNLLFRMSWLISDKVINQLMVAVFVLNCWSTPLLRFVFRNRDPFVGRLARHIVSMMLASLFTIPVNSAIWRYAMPRVPEAILFDQVTTARVRYLLMFVMISEWRQVLSTRLAAFMAILAIETLKRKIVAMSRDVATVVAVADLPPDTSTDHPREETPKLSRPRSRLRYCSYIFDFVWFAFGCLTVFIHMQALRPPTPLPGIKCDMPMYPWASLTFSCAVVEFNCYRAGIQGSSLELLWLISTINIAIVSTIRFTHCLALAMPPLIPYFSNIGAFEVYNSTIASWPASAALSRTTHPYLGSVWLIHVSNISTLPDGLLVHDFPSAEVILSFTDVASLPDDLADRWPRFMTKFVVEHSQLTQYPPALLNITCLALSLAGNHIPFVPGDALGGTAMVYVSFAGNSELSKLPDDGWISSVVFLWGTNLSAPPQWAITPPVRTWGYLAAGGTPACAPYGVGSVIPLASGMYLDCNTQSVRAGLFPIEAIAPLRTP